MTNMLAYKVAHDCMVEELDKIGKEVLDTFHGNPDFEWNVVIGYTSRIAMQMDFASSKATLSGVEKDLAAACYQKVEQRLMDIFGAFENSTQCLIFELVYMYIGADGSRRIEFNPIPLIPQNQN